MTDAELTALAEKFAPELRLHPYDNYRPSKVDLYFGATQLCDPTGKPVVMSGPPNNPSYSPVNPTMLPAGKAGLGYYLQIVTQSVMLGDLGQANVYVNIRDVQDPQLAGYTDLQYWFFYGYRGSSVAHIEGTVGMDNNVDLAPLGEHQGDWKHVTVRVDPNQNLSGVYYAAHDRGTWYSAVAGTPQGFNLNGNGQPIVYSALNSHSCYPQASTYVEAGTMYDWTVASFWLTEQTLEGGPTLNCSTCLVYLAGLSSTPTPPWVHFGGKWGPTVSQDVTDAPVVSAAAAIVLAVPWLPPLLGPFAPFLVAPTTVALVAAVVLSKLHPRRQSGPESPGNQDSWGALVSYHVGVTSDGKLFYNVRQENGKWDGFVDVSTQVANSPGGYTQASCATIGTVFHLVAVTGSGELVHTLQPNPWNTPVTTKWQQGFGNVGDYAGGSPGNFLAVACAAIGSNLYVVVASQGKGVFYTIRSSQGNGSWSNFQPVPGALGDPVTANSIACAAVGNDLHIVGMSLGPISWHIVWHTDQQQNAWSASDNFQQLALNPTIGPMVFRTVACAMVEGRLLVLGVTNPNVPPGANLFYTLVDEEGWQPFQALTDAIEDQYMGTFVAVSAVDVNDEWHVLGVTSDGHASVAYRLEDGDWDQFDDLSFEGTSPTNFVSIASASPTVGD